MIHLMIVHLFGLMTPGPDFFYISRMAAGNSRRNTLCAIIGITLGVAFWATAAMLGLAIVLKTTPMLQGVVMVAGGSYLMYLGFLKKIPEIDIVVMLLIIVVGYFVELIIEVLEDKVPKALDRLIDKWLGGGNNGDSWDKKDD